MKATLPALAAIAIQFPLFGLLCLLPMAATGAGIAAEDLAFFGAAILLAASATVLLVGLPVFALLRRAGRAGMASSILAGFLIGVLPVALMGWPPAGLYAGYSSGGQWFGHAVDLYRNGAPTWYAWLDYALNMARLGIQGAAGAAVFHWVWRRSSAR